MSQRDVIRLLNASPTVAPLDIRRASDIEARPIDWLWPGQIARGKVTLLAGHPGLGKSQISLDVAAVVTSGRQWPVTGMIAERGSVIIFSAEDDSSDTIRPRLEAAGADLIRCHIVEATQDVGKGGKLQRRGFSLVDDLDRLDAEVRRLGDVVAVIIDPISAYLGTVDSHRNAEVRATLAPLAQLGEQHRLAVIAVSHLRKTMQGDAVLQVTGSLAFAAAARAVLIVARDPADPSRRLLLPAKNNISEDRTGYAYRVEPVTLPGGINTSRIAWANETVTITAEQALAPRTPKVPTKLAEAAGWLRGFLANGPIPQTRLRAAAEDAGHSWPTIRRAQKNLRIKPERDGFGPEGEWAWRLPDVVNPGTEIEL